MTQNGKIDAEWLLLTLNDAAEELAHAINLIEEDPRKAEGVMEHEITALYAAWVRRQPKSWIMMTWWPGPPQCPLSLSRSA